MAAPIANPRCLLLLEGSSSSASSAPTLEVASASASLREESADFEAKVVISADRPCMKVMLNSECMLLLSLTDSRIVIESTKVAEMGLSASEVAGVDASTTSESEVLLALLLIGATVYDTAEDVVDGAWLKTDWLLVTTSVLDRVVPSAP